MNPKERKPRKAFPQRVVGLGLALAGGLAMSSAQGEEIPLTATFRPNALNPTFNEFIDQTPISGVCQLPKMCPNGERSVNLDFTVTYGPLRKEAPAEEQATIRIPSAWRTVVVKHVETGQATEVRWRAFLFGSTYVLPRDATEITGSETDADAHKALWVDKTWNYPPAGCLGTYMGYYGSYYYTFAWLYPVSAPACVKDTNFDFEGMDLRSISIGYEMISPNPLAMASGTYTGTLPLRIGPGLDFDFGANATASVPEVTLSFTLDVSHDFQVAFPPDPTARLMPLGGWEQWTEYGKLPARLQQRVPFQITSSGEFSLKMRCEYQVEAQCGIRNPSTQTTVPLEVSATMPSMHLQGESRPAVDAPLVSEHSGQRAPRFVPIRYAPGVNSSINFAVVGDAVKTMLDEPPTTWQGEVTVIFDADP